MKHCQKLTREQKKLLMRHNLDSYDFYLIKSVKNGFLFQSKSDPETLIVCYPDSNNIYMKDGITPVTNL